MPLPTQTAFGERFHRRLATIRVQIETLPETQRPYFPSLADEAETNHRSMESDCLKARAIVDDLSLSAAAMDFALWSAAKEIRHNLREGGFC